ncbi:MAG: Vms1/Ankzf1 family peptidyl-tRNA hydrolase [Nitrososphaerales archaeon]
MSGRRIFDKSGHLTMHGTLPLREWYDVNRFTRQLKSSEPPVLSLYLPSRRIAQGSKILAEKKDRTVGLEEVRANIEDKLGRIKHRSGSLCIFGWSSKGRSIIKQVTISMEVPPLYVVHRKPYLKPLKDILEIGHEVIVIVMDHQKAKVELFDGSQLVKEIAVKTYLKGRHKKGGWSQQRFQRNRDIQIKHFFDKVNQKVLSLGQDDLEIVLLGGRGLAKKEFSAVIDDNLAEKTHIIEGITFDTPERDISKHVISTLDSVRKAKELKLLAGLAAPAKRGLVYARNDGMERKLAEGTVKTLFLAADYYASSASENQLIRRIIALAKRKGSTIEFITNSVARKRLHKFGNLVALLRYR